MRIIAIVRDWRGDERRQRVVEHLNTKWEVVRVVPRLPRSFRLLNLLLSISVSRTQWRERSKKNPFFFWAVSEMIRKRVIAQGRCEGDVILTFEALFSPGTGRRILKPFVMYEDATSKMALTHWPAWVPSTARTTRYQRLESRCYEEADRVLTTNEWVRHSLIQDYGIVSDRVKNVGQGHDLAESRDFGECSGPILFVGYEFIRKGGAILLKAFHKVRAKYPEASLVVVGAELDCRDPGVRVLGTIKDKSEMRRIYLQAGIFVLPSLFDPMPHAVIEAMSVGVPVIVSDACGSKEIVKHGVNGFVVPAGSVDALADRLIELMDSEALRLKLGREGARTVKESCRWEKIAERIGHILEEVSVASTCFDLRSLGAQWSKQKMENF
jgi:glycosyltransferase involved in cell wall biosynthesis